MTAPMDRLSDQETRLFAFFSLRGRDTDIRITDIYDYMYVDGEATTNAERQRYVGAYISKLNRKMLAYFAEKTGSVVRSPRIIPGELKRTYRLVIE